jgi:hypothetical protein
MEEVINDNIFFKEMILVIVLFRPIRLSSVVASEPEIPVNWRLHTPILHEIETFLRIRACSQVGLNIEFI